MPHFFAVVSLERQHVVLLHCEFLKTDSSRSSNFCAYDGSVPAEKR